MGGASGKRRTATREDSSPMAVRRAVLDHVRAGSKNTSASNFQILRGKVGIITGVGPPMGIGVSLQLYRTELRLTVCRRLLHGS